MKILTILSLLLLTSPAFSQLTKEDIRSIIKEENATLEKRMKEYIDLKIDGVEKSLNAKIDGVEKSLNAKIDATNAKIDALDKSLNAKIDATNAKIDALEKSLNAKIDATNTRIDETNTRIDELNKSLNAKIDGVEKSLNAKIDEMDKGFGRAWILILALIGLITAVVALPRLVVAYRGRGQRKMQSQIDQLNEKLEAMQSAPQRET